MESKENDTHSQEKSKTKAPFNKKKWREQKYSNKAKVMKWEHIKRKQALRQYNKELKKCGMNYKPKNASGEYDNSSNNSFREAQIQYKKIQQEKEEKRKDWERIKRERSEALKAYKEKKAMKFRKLSQKTKKGQPLMRGRIELLLEKIQRDYANNNNNNQT